MKVSPRGLSRFLSLIVDGSSQQRLSLSHCSEDLRLEFLQYSGESSLVWALLEPKVGSLDIYITLLSISRMLALACSEAVFHSPAPNFRALARCLLVEHFNVDHPDSGLIKDFSIILKRIRRFGIDGRDGHEGFKLDSPRDRELLRSQKHRCNLCLYKFSDTLDLYYDEDIDYSHAPLKDEVCLDSYQRRPEIDHIIPISIGGNSDKNLQILCKSCNLGKSDWISSIFTMPYAGRGRAYRRRDSISHQMRYAVLAPTRGEMKHVVDVEGMCDTSQLRIFRRNSNLATSETNLIARLA